jgi:hypothetical protein
MLDWATVDRIKEERWTEHPFPGTLPASLKNTIENQLYAIPENFLKEIRLCSLKAAEEIGTRGLVASRPNSLPPPTTPAISFILNAFNILADCVYDPDTNYFSRSNIKYVLAYILAFKFWAHQIPPTILDRYAGLRDLALELQGLEQTNPIIYKDLIRHYQSLIDHKQKLIKNQAKEKVKKIEEATLDDFLTNKRAAASLNKVNLKIPGVGEILFSKITFTKRGGITLFGELDFISSEKVLTAYSKGQFPEYFTAFLNDKNSYYILTKGQVEGLSGNPPPIIKMKFEKIQRKDTEDDLNSVTYPVIQVKQNIDPNEIKKKTHKELQNHEEFKGINILSRSHSSIIRRN